jgi:carbamate kinase
LNSGTKVVVALGGNALVKTGQRGTVYEQFANARTAILHIVKLVKMGYRIILTHGNGPQVGNILIRVKEALGKAYEVPLGVAVAEAQGEMGYMIEQTLQNRLILERIRKSVVTVLTQVVCARDDPSLGKPEKPIGPFYSREEAGRLMAAGLKMIEDSGRGWRHVVPSPNPLAIVEKETIKKLVDLGIIVIAAGGGGMPVYIEKDGTYEGIDAVVDKDLASSVLASDIRADELFILTSVDAVMLDFNSPSQRPIREIDTETLKKHLADGQFPPGSMGPKVRAVIRFIEEGGKMALITSPEMLIRALEGKTGTRVIPGERKNLKMQPA